MQRASHEVLSEMSTGSKGWLGVSVLLLQNMLDLSVTSLSTLSHKSSNISFRSMPAVLAAAIR